MKQKNVIASVRPSPLASIVGIIGLVAMLIIGSSFQMESGGFMTIWTLVCIGGILYFLINLLSFSASSKDKIPMTAGEVVEIVSEKSEPETENFESRLRKLESLKKDGLITEEEYQQKRGEIMKEKW
jgi:hypothetical protein